MKPLAFAPAALGLVFATVGGISSAAPTADYRFNPVQLQPLSPAQLILIAKPVDRKLSSTSATPANSSLPREQAVRERIEAADLSAKRAAEKAAAAKSLLIPNVPAEPR